MQTHTESMCTKCGQTKPASEFHNDRRSANGLAYWCKPCKRTAMGVTQRETRAVTVEQQFIDEATALLAPKPTTSLRSRLRARRDRSQSDDGFALVLAYVFQTAHHHPNNKRLQVAADRLRRNPRGDHGSYVSSILFNAFEKTQRGTEMYDRVRATIPIITEQKRKTIQTREFNSTNMPKGVMNGRGSDNGSNCFDE